MEALPKAIKFEDDEGDKGPKSKPETPKVRREQGSQEPAEPGAELPFAKPVRPEKKGRK